MSASKSRATLSQGKVGWCVIFRHPLRKDSDGKLGLRVRRGLGTTDRDRAQFLVDQLNQIMQDPTLWNMASREIASMRFDERIVAAFYDPMIPSTSEPWENRDKVIPLPGGKDSSDGYARVLFVGTTVSGKTTIVRQLLGTDPDSERFPSISAAKTTICDLEIVLKDGPFKAVVTFLPRDLVRQYTADCVISAVLCKLEDASERDVARRFLEHSDQRFRLSYILGSLSSLEKQVKEEFEDECEESTFIFAKQNELNEIERKDLLSTLKKYLNQISELAYSCQSLMNERARDLGIKSMESRQEDRDTLMELVEDDLSNKDELHKFVDEILDDIESRFKLLSEGEILFSRDGWPISWTYQNADRPSFIRLVNRFSSNFAPSFGRLLSPLVEGIRVSGPFSPEWHQGSLHKMVLMDGEGIGHTADSTSSLSTSVTSKFEKSDAIVLVDNAAQPMQAGTCAVLQSLVSSGHDSKLNLVFTHFDEVKGDNLIDIDAKMDHVISSFENVIHAMGKSYGRRAESSLRNLIPRRLMFMSKIHMKLPEKARTLSELKRLLIEIENSIIRPAQVQYTPVYDVANLVLAIQKAVQEFHDQWKGILGMGSVSGFKPEHWARIKALARRLGLFKRDEYDTLKPVADLIRLLQIHVSVFLTNPLDWLPSPPPEESPDRASSIDAVKKEVFARLHILSKRRILEERVREWIAAYEYRGQGSTRVRARDVVAIYEEAAPIPNGMPEPDANKFLFELRELVARSVKAAGGQLKGWTHGEKADLV